MLQFLTRADLGFRYFFVAVLLTYGVVAVQIAALFPGSEHYLELVGLTYVACVSLFIGYMLKLFDKRFAGLRGRVVISEAALHATISVLFIGFALVAWATAEQIPLFAAFSGADPETLNNLRERFLKAREGWQSSFVYVHAILAGALVPYMIARMFINGSRFKWAMLFFFLFYCLSFLEKAFFLKLALPLLYLSAQRKVNLGMSPKAIVLWIALLMSLVTVFSGAGTSEEVVDDAFFTASYTPQGALEHFVWRSVAIPLITAADAIRVLNEEFNGHYLWGATSSLIAGLFGLEKIEFERMVFSAEWGQNAYGTGSANSVYMTEAFVNFGWVGVILFSLAIGQVFRMFAKSRDEAFRSLWMLFAFGAYTSGFIGLLFSNGFILLFFINLFVKIRPARARRAALAAPTTQSATIGKE